MVKHIHVPIPNQRAESASLHVVEEGAVRTALTQRSLNTSVFFRFSAGKDALVSWKLNWSP